MTIEVRRDEVDTSWPVAPAGEYTLMVREVTWKTVGSGDNAGADMPSLRFAIEAPATALDPEGEVVNTAGIGVFDQFPIATLDGVPAREGGKVDVTYVGIKRLMELSDACGFVSPDGSFNVEQMVGLEFQAQVGIEVQKEGARAGEKRNNIKKYIAA